MNRPNFHVKRGDSVQVISGKHKGSTGKILQVIPKKLHVLIEGVRIIKKHAPKSQNNPQGAIVEREGPIHISNVRLFQAAEQPGKMVASKASKKTR